MTVQDDVDLVGLEHTQVHLRHLRRGRAEQDIGELGGDHRAAPAIAQAGAHGVQQDVDPVVVHAHVGAVQHLDVLPVDAAWIVRRSSPRFPGGPSGRACHQGSPSRRMP